MDAGEAESAEALGQWRSVISDEDRAAMKAAGYGRRLTPGSAPALLVVDATHAFVGQASLGVDGSAERFPLSSGPVAWRSLDRIARLRDAFHRQGRPVIYSVATGKDELAGLWVEKTDRDRRPDPFANTIPDAIAPGPDDLVLAKTKPSMFHGTPLTAMLVRNRIDTLVITGGTTSGCVRATVTDAFSHNYRALVVEDAVFDRSRISHAVNLFDMEQKYASVVDCASVERLLTEEWRGISG
jgi:isochorismate hydrolase